MPTIWCVTFATTEKHFDRKAASVAWLRALAADVRIRPVVVKRCPGAYTYYGPGREETVLRANIDRIAFVSFRRKRA